MKHIFHVSCSIDGLLRQRRKLIFLEDENGKRLSDQQARAELRALQEKGWKYIKTGACDNFDPKNGCLGHEKEEP